MSPIGISTLSPRKNEQISEVTNCEGLDPWRLSIALELLTDIKYADV